MQKALERFEELEMPLGLGNVEAALGELEIAHGNGAHYLLLIYCSVLSVCEYAPTVAASKYHYTRALKHAEDQGDQHGIVRNRQDAHLCAGLNINKLC